MIPKIIHYCWFGDGEIPEKDKKCIESWKKYCPDYKIICWTEKEYDVTKNDYMREAYESKKWGFVPDYARLDIIYNYGGIYLDTDVEIIKNLDELLNNKAYFGFEDKKYINPGLGFAAEAGNNGILELMKTYDKRQFKRNDGTLDLTASPIIISNVFLKNGALMNDKLQSAMGITLYPTEYFCPKSFVDGKITITDKTYTIHHFNASWNTPIQKNIHKIESYFRRMEYFYWMGRMISLPLRVINKFQNGGLKNVFKTINNKIKNKKEN